MKHARRIALIVFILALVGAWPVVRTTTADPVDRTPVLIGFKNTPGPAEAALIHAANGKIKYEYHTIPVLAVSLPQAAIYGLSHNPRIDFIEEDGTAEATAETIPWGITAVKSEHVWALENTGAGAKIAILDTGIDYMHADLAPHYAGGYDYVNSDDDPMDDEGHGTHVSGTAAAVLDGVFGVAGVAPDASLYGVKVLDQNGDGFYSDIIAGIEWAVDNGIDVVSMSLSGAVRSRALQKACDAAYKAEVVLVAAAGNNGNVDGRGRNVGYPAKYNSVIAVAAIDSLYERAWFSSTGGEVELAAPGVEIVSDFVGGGFAIGDGTSMACPHVAGVAALIVATGNNDASAIREAMTSTALDLGPVGRDKLYGYGLVDALAATAGAPPPPDPDPDPEEPGTISGKIKNAATGKTIGGATIKVFDTGQSVVTKRNGRYKINNVPAGEHDVTCTAAGYVTQTVTVAVAEGLTTTINFALVPE